MTFVSTLGQAQDQTERIKQLQLQLATFQTQLASGKKTDLFKGLGVQGLTSQRARAEYDQTDTYANNITIAQRRLKLMLTSVNEFKEQAKNLENAIRGQIQEGDFDLGTVKNLADNIYDFMINLVNTKDGDRYLFGGSEATTQPLTNTGLLDSYAVSQVDDWLNNTITTDTLISNYHDRAVLSDTLVGYTASLSGAKNVSVRVEDHTEIVYTTLGNADPFRDVIAATGMVRNLLGSLDQIRLETTDPPGTVVPPGADNDQRADNFFQVFNDIAITINAAVDQLDTEGFRLSQIQAQITKIGQEHEQAKNVLLDTISGVEDADMTDVALSITQLQTQLEASFRVTALASNLSLVNFL